MSSLSLRSSVDLASLLPVSFYLLLLSSTFLPSCSLVYLEFPSHPILSFLSSPTSCCSPSFLFLLFPQSSVSHPFLLTDIFFPSCSLMFPLACHSVLLPFLSFLLLLHHLSFLFPQSSVGRVTLLPLLS